MHGGRLFFAAAFAIATTPAPSRAQEPAKDRDLVVEKAGKAFDAGRKWAVLVGVDKYLDPKVPSLQFCGSDARLLARKLEESCGYDADNILLLVQDQKELHLHPSGINLRNQIVDWLKLVKKGDTVIVSFSGHGFLDADGNGYLAPQDLELAHVGLTGYPVEELRKALRNCEATQKLLILDCCHAGSAKAIEKPVGPSSQELGGAFRDAEGLITLASCRKDEKSQEWGDKKQGLFTYWLAEGLSGAADFDKNGLVDSDEAYRFTFEKVPTTAQRVLNARQTPVRIIGDDVAGVFALARVTKPDSPQPPPPPPVPEMLTEITNSIGMKLVMIPAGEFEMGSPANEVRRYDNEGPQQAVRITKPFYFCTTEVNQSHWQRVMRTKPWSGKPFVKEGPGYAATYLSWLDAVKFCNALSTNEGRIPCYEIGVDDVRRVAGTGYRLPTEAEWEFACRAGSKTRYSFGDGDGSLSEYAWFEQNAYKAGEAYPHAVGQLRANEWRLFDMHGNASEWCWDRFGHYASVPGVLLDPQGPSDGLVRVIRGGCWSSTARDLRTAHRDKAEAGHRDGNLGFRVALENPTPKPQAMTTRQNNAPGMRFPLGRQLPLIAKIKVDNFSNFKIDPDRPGAHPSVLAKGTEVEVLERHKETDWWLVQEKTGKKRQGYVQGNLLVEVNTD